MSSNLIKNTSETREQRFEKIQALALHFKGSCVSKNYEGAQKKINFCCALGHEFQLSYNKLFSCSAWCPQCSLQKRKAEKFKESDFHEGVEVHGASVMLARLRRYVADRQGRVLTPQEEQKTAGLVKIQCGDGHVWERTPGGILKNNSWCPECSNPMSLINIRKIAEEKGGACLSIKRGGYRQKLLFRCGQGHSWSASPYAIVHSGSWCTECARIRHCLSEEEKAKGLAQIRKIAKDRDGLYLSGAYESCNSVLKFKCAEGHHWSVRATSLIHNNTWCPACAGNLGERLSVEFVKSCLNREFKKVHPQWLRGTFGRNLELDAYCEELSFAVEYQGQQHYEFISGWHKTEARFIEGQERDALKRKLCAEQGVLLFEIPYVDRPTPEKIAAHIERLAQEAGLPFAINPDWREKQEELSLIHI